MRTWQSHACFQSSLSTAYHEAAHVVVAYEFGWWVWRGGIRICRCPQASLGWRSEDYNSRARICVGMAGLVAEEKLHSLRCGFEDEVIRHILALRAGEETSPIVVSDERAVALAIVEDEPCRTLSGARRVIAYWRDETNSLLDQPRVWGGIERLAKKLVRRRYLSPRGVAQALGSGFFSPGQAVRWGRATLK
jgi:hypothetical protein